MAVPQHIPLLLPPSPTRSSAENITWWSLRYLFDTVLGHLGAGLCQESVFLQTASSCSCLPRHPPQSNSWLTFSAIPRHTECWLYPSNACPFFRRKKSIEIDLKMSNLINGQLSLQDRYFLDGVNVWFHQDSFLSWQSGVSSHKSTLRYSLGAD